MQRRDFIKVVASSAITWPLAAHGQQPALPVIGFVHASSPARFGAFVDAFRQGLRETGYIEGQNVAIEFRWAENHNERVPALIADLVQQSRPI
jgi:putative tryptophan/tyrosine transport system substrate-binding protein